MAWTLEDHEKFDGAAEGILKRTVPGIAALDGESFDEKQQLWTMAFIAFKPEITQVEVPAAISQFESFIKMLIPWDMERRVTVHFKLGRNYGAEYVEFGLSDLSQPGHAAMKAANDRLIGTVLREHDAYAANHLAKSPATNGRGSRDGEYRSQPQSVLVETGNKIDLSVKDGKKGYSIKVGNWQKFGVRIFPEVLKAAGIEPESIPIEGLDIGNCDIHYTMKPDGQYPDKVVKIVRL